ncbi:MAG: hypothetical protein BV458_11660 [Thermoplasmata archaeon M9B2D]|nr:MAG: hypothetical protein BV458_11660 [Thermoplasmata archaeon M9B2D]
MNSNKNLIIFSLFWGSLSIIVLARLFFQDIGWIKTVQTWIIPVFSSYWVQTDAIERAWKKNRATLYGISSFFLAPIAVPVYLVKSRGWQQASIITVRFLLHSIIFLLCMVIIKNVFEPNL